MDSRIWNGSEWIEGAFGKNYKEYTVECGANRISRKLMVLDQQTNYLILIQ